MIRFNLFAAVLAGALAMSTPAFSQVDVSTGGPVTTYANLKLAFDAINAGTHTGAITVSITAAGTDPAASAVLNSSGAGAASYTSVLIRPTADLVSVSATAPGGRGVIEFNGADNVTIDGDNPNTAGTNRDLTIQNLAAATTTYTSCVRIATTNVSPYETANNITIKNLILTGNVTSGNAVGVTSTTGSSNASFGVIVGPNGGSAISAITSVTGTMSTAAPVPTANNVLIDNNAVNQVARGIVFLGGNSSSSTGVTITNNIVGAAATLTGDPPYTSPAATVYTKGIYIQGTNAITISGNTVQNILSYVATTLNGIELNSSIGSGTIAISNNTVNGVVNNAGTNAAQGIGVANAGAAYAVTNNVVNNVQVASGVNNLVVSGIVANTSAPSGTIANNTVTTVYSRTSGVSSAASGIFVQTGSSVTVQNNFVAEVLAPATTATIGTSTGTFGLRIASGSNHKVYHNSVHLFGTSSATGLATAFIMNLTSQTGCDVRNNIFSNIITGPAATSPVVCVYLPSLGSSTLNLTWNNNAYYVGAAAGAGVAQVGTTLNLYLAGNFNAGATTPATNFRSYTSALGFQNLTNDNASFLSTLAPPFTSNTNLHIPAATTTQLESAGAAIAVTTDIDNQSRSVTTPDIGADEFSGTVSDLTAPGISYATLMQTASLSNRTFAGVQITDNGGVNGTVGTRPRVYYKRNTDANAFNDNTSGTAGWKYAEATGSSSPFDFTINYALLSGGTGITIGDTVQYFVVAQDLMPTPNVGIHSGIFAATPTSVALTAAAFPIGNTINSYTIVGGLSGTITVGTGGTYTSLTEASPNGLFAAINASSVTGNITATIISDITEPGTVALNRWAEDGAGGYTLNIMPDAAILRTISGTAVADLTPMININGSQRTTFDGRFGGSGRWLLFRNTKAAAANTGPTFQFSNLATDDAIRNCIVENNTSSSSFGTIFVASGSAAVSSLATNILIDNCILRDATGGTVGQTNNAVLSSSGFNSNVTVTNNEISNWTSSAIAFGSIGDNCTVSNNSFFKTSGTVIGTIINFGGTTSGGGHTISGNSLGGSAADRSGAPLNYSGGAAFSPMYVNVKSALTNVANNRIANIGIASGTAMNVINIPAGATPNIALTGNVIGGKAVTGNPQDTIMLSAGPGFLGIACFMTSGSATIEGNAISNITAAPSGIGATMQAIVSTGSYPKTIRNNVIRDIAFNTTPVGVPPGPTAPCGIIVANSSTASDAITVEGNEVYNLTNTGPNAGANMVGIFIRATFAGSSILAQRNRVYNLSATNSATGGNSSVIFGMYLLNSQALAMNIQNNMIALGTSSNDTRYFGFEDSSSNAASVSNYYYNSISLDGTHTGLNDSYAFSRAGTSNITFMNNILSNARSGGSGSHYAITNRNAAATGWSASSSNYNDLYAANAATVGKWLSGGAPVSLAGWQAASGGDAQSISTPVTFTSATDLHLTAPSAGDPLLKGTPIAGITVDFDNEVRDTQAPYIGADEALPRLPISLASFTGRVIQNQSVQLEWRTISEINNYGFYVQRKRTGDTDWLTLNTEVIPGFGTTNEPHDYSYIDRNVPHATLDYRLKSVDLDGTVYYTEPIVVSSPTDVVETAPRTFALFQNYPNPFNPESVIKFSVETTGRTTLDVFNTLGQKVATAFDDVAEAGQYYKVSISGRMLASGMYFYRLHSGARSDVKKMLLLK